jgi:hypothetical protein
MTGLAALILLTTFPVQAAADFTVQDMLPGCDEATRTKERSVRRLSSAFMALGVMSKMHGSCGWARAVRVAGPVQLVRYDAAPWAIWGTDAFAQ